MWESLFHCAGGRDPHWGRLVILQFQFHNLILHFPLSEIFETSFAASTDSAFCMLRK